MRSCASRVGSEDEHERLAPAVGEHARLVPALLVVVDHGRPVSLIASQAMPSKGRAARRRRHIARRAAALNERLRAERSS